MRLLITGSKGQLGSEINALSHAYPAFEFFFTGREALDICNKNSIESFVDENKIDGIINYEAYTAVDKAESEPELAKMINHIDVQHLAEIAKEKAVKLIHISTDHVFNGKGFKPYTVDHPNLPVNTYCRTKLAGEASMKKYQSG